MSSGSVARIIQAAVARGAPMFNAGDARGCAQTYEDAAKALMSAHTADLSNANVRGLDAAVQDSSTKKSPKDRAWALRRALDSCLSTPGPSRGSTTTSALSSSSWRELIRSAISEGVPMFNSGDARGCAQTYRTCALALVARHSDTLAGDTIRKLQAAAALPLDDSITAWQLRTALDEAAAAPAGSGGARQPGAALPSSAGKDFAAKSGNALLKDAAKWRSVDDSVMGGRSRSLYVHNGSFATFSGEIVTQGGGFASVETSGKPNGWSSAKGVRLEVQGIDGQKYKMYLRLSGQSSRGGVQWQADFDTVKASSGGGVWTTVDLPFSSFVPSWRGQVMNDGQRLDPSLIEGFGFRLSLLTELGFPNPKFGAGPFQVNVRSIEATK